jgi:type II secretion system protein N
MIGRLSWPVTFDLKNEPLAWACAGLGSFLLFLFLTFPYGALQARILAEVTRGTGWEVRAAEWSPGFPVAVEWHDLVWTKPGTAIIPVQSMRLSVGVMALLSGRHHLDGFAQFPGTGQSGSGRATVTLNTSSWSFLGPVSFKGRLQQIDLAGLVKPFVARGTLQADLAQGWENRGAEGIAFKGNGSWRAEIKDLVLDHIPAGTLVIPSLTFNRVTLLLTCRDAICEVTEFKGDGPDMSVTAQGRLILQQPLQLSTLDLTVTILAGPGWAQKAGSLPIPPPPPGVPLTFKLTGSVANPKLTL